MRFQFLILGLLTLIGGSFLRAHADIPATPAARRALLSARSDTLDLGPAARAVIARAPIWRAQGIGELALIGPGVIKENFYLTPHVAPDLDRALRAHGLRTGMTAAELAAYEDFGRPPIVTPESSFTVLDLPGEVRWRLHHQYGIATLADLVREAPGLLFEVNPLHPTGLAVLEHQLRTFRLPGDVGLLTTAEWDFITHVQTTRPRLAVRNELVTHDVRTFDRLAEVAATLKKDLSTLPTFASLTCGGDLVSGRRRR